MPDLVSELNSLDFSIYIGGPLQAAIQAQQAASMSTVEFIKAVGFDSTGTDLQYVEFKFKKNGSNPTFDPAATSGPNSLPTVPTDVTINMPAILMYSVPALRIQKMTIDFNARLTSTETSNVSSEFAASAELGINYKIVNFKASASYKRTSTSGVSVEKTYTMGVHVEVENDELPEGLDRILTMLEEAIK